MKLAIGTVVAAKHNVKLDKGYNKKSNESREYFSGKTGTITVVLPHATECDKLCYRVRFTFSDPASEGSGWYEESELVEA